MKTAAKLIVVCIFATALLQGCSTPQINKPASPQKIPIEFSIGGNGRVTKVWVDHPEYKNGPLPECLLTQLQKWPFKTHDGENVNVSLSFTVGTK